MGAASTPLHPSAQFVVQVLDENDPESPLEAYLYNPPFGAGGRELPPLSENEGWQVLAYSDSDPEALTPFLWLVTGAAAFHNRPATIGELGKMREELKTLIRNSLQKIGGTI